MALAMTRGRRARLLPAADPNVIPFIDVLLVLLIIFMVTAPKPTTDLHVDMPPNRPGAPPVIEPTIVDLRATPGGYAIYIGAREAPLEAIGAAALAHILAANPAILAEDAHADARVYVRAELDVAYAPVVAVIEHLREARFAHVSIIAQDARAG